MEVILFYALLIGSIALAATAYLAFLIVPVKLIARRFGVLAGAAFAAVLATAIYLFYQPPLAGGSLAFAPPGMRANLFIVGMIQDPPIATLVAGAVVSSAGFAILSIAWLVRGAQSR